MKALTHGVWPTMITPYTDDDKIDYDTIEKMVDWYIDRNVAGIFAVCQSSEMFHLSYDERIELARNVVQCTSGRVQVIASGHISESAEDQVAELCAVADSGVDALVLLTNRLTIEGAHDDEWKRQCERLLSALPTEIPLGMYECPYPYKKSLSPELLKWCADTGRFVFLKDTCCNPPLIREKIAAVRNTQLELFNANAASLLISLQMGAAGFSGVMANFHPELYAWLCENWQEHPDDAAELQAFLGLASMAEYQKYPINAKYYQQINDIPIKLHTRKPGLAELTPSQRLEIEQLSVVSAAYIRRFVDNGS